MRKASSSFSGITAFQADRFKLVWNHIIQTPFYQRKLAKNGIPPSQAIGLEQIERLPFTYKQEIRQSDVFDRTPLTSENIYAIYSSGGTSGQPTLYAWSHEDIHIQLEISKTILQGLGITNKDLALILAPLHLPVMGHCMVRQFEAVGAGFVPLGPAEPDHIIKFLRNLPITVIATLPVGASRLYEYMRYRLNLMPSDYLHLKNFLLGGDFLSNARRLRLENDWKVKCYNLYGISEIFGPICGECSQQDGLHFVSDLIYVEVLDPITQKPVAKGETGVAVFTTLWEKGFPLLRYWTDDYVTWTTEPCACGVKTPRLNYRGRILDSAFVNDRRFFAQDVEEVLFSFPIGDEYTFEYSLQRGSPCVLAHLESLPEMEISKAELKEALEALFNQRVVLILENPGSLPRKSIKPLHLIGFPRHN